MAENPYLSAKLTELDLGAKISIGLKKVSDKNLHSVYKDNVIDSSELWSDTDSKTQIQNPHYSSHFIRLHSFYYIIFF